MPEGETDLFTLLQEDEIDALQDFLLSLVVDIDALLNGDGSHAVKELTFLFFEGPTGLRHALLRVIDGLKHGFAQSVHLCGERRDEGIALVRVSEGFLALQEGLVVEKDGATLGLARSEQGGDELISVGGVLDEGVHHGNDVRLGLGLDESALDVTHVLGVVLDVVFYVGDLVLGLVLFDLPLDLLQLVRHVYDPLTEEGQRDVALGLLIVVGIVVVIVDEYVQHVLGPLALVVGT